MACPDCEATRMQFLEMRQAILIFARTLNQYEAQRLAEIDSARPEGAPAMSELRALIERDAGLTLSELASVREAHG
jgi:hypothetical protein